MHYASLIVMLALAQYTWFSFKVGGQRARSGIKAPAVTGDEMFERAFRVQQNTLEQLIVFVPAAFTYAAYASPVWLAAPAALFIVGRFLYAHAYMNDPARRGPGFGMTLAGNAWLVIGTVVAIAIDLA